MAGTVLDNIKSRVSTATKSGGLIKGFLSPFSGNVGMFGQASGILPGLGSGAALDDKLSYLAKKFNDAASQTGIVNKVLTLLRPQILVTMGVASGITGSSSGNVASNEMAGNVSRGGFFGAVTSPSASQNLNKLLSGS